MMLKDLRLAQQAAGATAAATPLGASAASLYQLFVDDGGRGRFLGHLSLHPQARA